MIAAVRGWLLTLVLLLTACGGDDPYAGIAGDPCAPGNVRTGRSACLANVATIAADGDAADWGAVPSFAVSAGTLQVARIAAGMPQAQSLAVRLAGVTPSAADPTLRWIVELTATKEFRVDEIDDVIAGHGELHLVKNDFVDDPPPGAPPQVALAFTTDGFELTIPVAILPFPYGARLAIYQQHSADGGATWTALGDTAPQARVCWIDSLFNDDGTLLYAATTDFTGDPCRK